MPQRLTYEYNDLSCTYRDDESDKDLFLQVSPSSVFLYWVNTAFPDGEQVWQVVRLHPHPNGVGADKIKYVYPDLIVVDACAERTHNATFPLGVFTRDQREAVLECADEVVSDEGSEEEEELGARWMSKLLGRMVSEGLVACDDVQQIRDAVLVLNRHPTS